MKVVAVFVLLALSGTSSADLWEEVSGVLTKAGQSIFDQAQNLGQFLVDTYVPVIGQAAQHLVGQALQDVGVALTSLANGNRQAQLQTESGQVVNDGIMSMLQHASEAINNIQNSISSILNGLFANAANTRSIQFKTKLALKADNKRIMRKLSNVVSNKVKLTGNVRIIQETVAALTDFVQPAVDAAADALQSLVNGAAVVSNAAYEIYGHAAQLSDNVTATAGEMATQLSQAVQPYIDDAYTIANSVNHHFQEQ